MFAFNRKKHTAKNPPSGDGHRKGAVKQRTQTYNPRTRQYVKRDSDTGYFIDVKQDGKPFKSISKVFQKNHLKDNRFNNESHYLLPKKGKKTK